MCRCEINILNQKHVITNKEISAKKVKKIEI